MRRILGASFGPQEDTSETRISSKLQRSTLLSSYYSRVIHNCISAISIILNRDSVTTYTKLVTHFDLQDMSCLVEQEFLARTTVAKLSIISVAVMNM
ncbi:hypothetical protein LENED_007162 [Lentinula edodes]|uniref:Uncharacterized protein n=1 Tax=Lentinula edodes TaxID=5353 RepID=A0A1Q3EDV8_LENED|nr:hypothetical protein LENED_007162 [Lentinula edodes]